ncbi:hypothetical protein STSO111631_08000 [Stackebrandtia soli]
MCRMTCRILKSIAVGTIAAVSVTACQSPDRLLDDPEAFDTMCDDVRETVQRVVDDGTVTSEHYEVRPAVAELQSYALDDEGCVVSVSWLKNYTITVRVGLHSTYTSLGKDPEGDICAGHYNAQLSMGTVPPDVLELRKMDDDEFCQGANFTETPMTVAQSVTFDRDLLMSEVVFYEGIEKDPPLTTYADDLAAVADAVMATIFENV